MATTRSFNIPEYEALRRLRELTAIGLGGGTPEDSVRRAIFRIMADFLRIVGELKRRIERGERCRIVELEQPSEPGSFHIKLKIESSGGP